MYESNTLPLLDTLLDQISRTGEVTFPFVIIQSDSGVDSFGQILAQCSEHIWSYRQDLVVLRDLAQQIEKKRHTLAVDVNQKDQIVQTEDRGPSANWWARQIIDRFALAPAGALKIVLIQDIHRMNSSAANALLKTFEEPLPGRMIIGTTSSSSWLLDTILSRAIVLRSTVTDLKTLAEQNSWQIKDKWLLHSSIALSGWREDLFQSLMDQQDLVSEFTELSEIIFEQQYSYKIPRLIKSLESEWTHQQLLDALIVLADMQWQHSIVLPLHRAKKMIQANVWAENVWVGLWLGE